MMIDGPASDGGRPRRPPHLETPDLGVGVGLRAAHYTHILEHRPEIGFFEAIFENYLGGGKPRSYLERVACGYPLVLHGVSLGIGGPEEPDRAQLTRLKELSRLVKAPWVTEHLCWSHVGGTHLHDLLPVPQTEAALRRIARRARMVQDFLELPFALENTSSYVTFVQSEMPEWEFISEVCERADIGLLLDVNNVYVSAFNHDLDALEFLRGLPHHRVLQFHLAGHTHFGTHIVDTHVGPVPEPVLELYREAIRLTGPVSTLLEWDQRIPSFPVLEAELGRIVLARGEGLAEDATPLAHDVVVRTAGQASSFQPGLVHGGGDLSPWSREPEREAALGLP